jgi:tetratricopeptide (TPR) repeat protein
VGIVALTLGLAACAPSASQKVEADIASVQKEANAKTLLDRGRAFATVGDHTRAEEYLASALDAGADPREVLPLLMDVCVRTGRYRSAIQHGENHLRKHPYDAETRVMVGALYTAINEGKLAKQQLERVVPPPSNGDDEKATADGTPAKARLQAQAHYLLGIVARDDDNDVVEADRHFREYLRIEPNGEHAEEAKASLLKRVP